MLPSSSASPSAPVCAAVASQRQSQWLPAVSLVLMACNLRAVFGSLSVVLPDTGLSAAGASLLTTLPIVCLGLFAAPTPWLSRRFGAERLLLLALLLIAGGTLARVLGSLPGLVKRHFPRRAALMTGFHTLAICIGATIATAATVPLQIRLFAGDRALAVWAAPAMVMLLGLPQALRTRAEPRSA